MAIEVFAVVFFLLLGWWYVWRFWRSDAKRSFAKLMGKSSDSSEKRKQEQIRDFRAKEAERRAFEEKVANAPPAPPPPQKQ